MNTQQFVQKANEIHNNFYNYSLTIYTENKNKIKIICPEHGEFEQLARNHIRTTKPCGCPKCGLLKLAAKKEKPKNNISLSIARSWEDGKRKPNIPPKPKTLTLKEFIEKASLVHNNKYNYSLVEYKNLQTKVKIICPEHGIFEQLAGNHVYRKRGCKLCSQEIRNNKITYDNIGFIEKANLIHNNKYDYKLVKYTHHKSEVEIICPTHGMFKQTPDSHINKKSGCPKCSNITTKPEIEIEKYLLSILPNLIIKKHRFFDKNKKRWEIDLYLPDHNLGIEYNGLYWHCELNKPDKNYHYNKYLSCKEKGIKLLQVWEDDWRDKQEIVKKQIKYLLKLEIKKVYARKCEVKEVDKKEANEFLNKNHLLGANNNSLYYGLYHNNDLVSVLGVGQGIANRQGLNWEITRFASSCNVVGGFSKLLKYTLPIYKNFVTYSQNDFGDGNLYAKAGFKLVKELKPDYTTIFNKYKSIRKCKSTTRKSNLKKMFPECDIINKTEHQICLENNIYRIYDSGKKKWAI